MRVACSWVVVSLLLGVACSDEPTSEPTSQPTPANEGSEAAQGCRTPARCVGARGGSDVYLVEAADRQQCAVRGGTGMSTDRCPPPPGGGCCRTTSGNARVVTCIYDGSTGDPGSAQPTCVSAGGEWDTVDRSGENRDTPQTPAEFVTGCDFAQRSDPGKTGRACVLYPADHVGQSCKEPLGVAVTTCEPAGRLGCCRRKGPNLGCYYEGDGVTLEGVQAECAAENGVWWPGLAP